jgi:type IV secretory pathway protease TraF
MVAVGMLVVVRPPEPLAAFLAEGRYLPRGVPLIKPVFAVAGQTVCRAGAVVTVDGRAAGSARARDGRERALPAWEGCRTIAGDEVFLMNAAEPSSLDGRYFGPLPLSAITGRAEPLLTFTVSAAAD